MKLKIASSAKRDFEQKIRRAWMFLQEAVVKLLALDLPCLTQVVLARLLLHGQVEMMHWMQVLKLQFRHLLPTNAIGS